MRAQTEVLSTVSRKEDKNQSQETLAKDITRCVQGIMVRKFKPSISSADLLTAAMDPQHSKKSEWVKYMNSQ